MLTLAEIKAYLNIDNTDFDVLLTFLLNNVVSKCESCTNNSIKSKDITDYHTGNGSGMLILKHYPITQIKKVYEINNNNGEETELDIASFYLTEKMKTNILYYLNNVFSDNETYKLVYTAGFTSLPLDLKQTILEMVSISFKESDVIGGVRGGRLGIANINESLDSLNTNTAFLDLTNRFQDILNKYKMPAF